MPLAPAGVQSSILGIIDKAARIREDAQSIVSVGGGTFWSRVDAAGDVAFENTVKGAGVAGVDTKVANYDMGASFTSLLRPLNDYFRAELTLTGLDGFALAHRFRVPQSAAELYYNSLSSKLNQAAVFPRQSTTLGTYSRVGAVDVASLTAGVTSADVGPGMIELLINSLVSPGGVFNLYFPTQTNSATKTVVVTLTAAVPGSIVKLGLQSIISPTGIGSTALPVATTAQFTVGEKVLVKDGNQTEIVNVVSIAANANIHVSSPMLSAFAIALCDIGPRRSSTG